MPICSIRAILHDNILQGNLFFFLLFEVTQFKRSVIKILAIREENCSAKLCISVRKRSSTPIVGHNTVRMVFSLQQ